MWKITLISVYNFHTASSFNANAGKVMKKLMGQTWKKKKIFSEYNAFPNPEMFSKGSQEGRYSGCARRVSVLNKLFMKHITDLLSTGEYSSEFSGYGIEINRVQISPDYMALNVFWVARNAQNDEIVEKLLKKNAGFLRHELSSLRVMGVVPIIQFVKDKHFSKIVEVESRLAKADFGEDHIPTEMATKLKSQMELFAPLPSAVKEKIKVLDGATLDEVVYEDEPPHMPQNVLGLDHSNILNRIKKNMKKSEAIHRCSKEPQLIQTLNESPVEFPSSKEEREAFKNFLEKREFLRNKARKLEKNYVPDIEYLKEEMAQRQADYFENMELYEDRECYAEDDEEIDN